MAPCPAARTGIDLDEHGSIEAPPGSRPWAIAMRREFYSALHDQDWASKNLKGLKNLFVEHKGYLQLSDRKGRPFRSFEAFCIAPYPFGLGYKVEDIDRIVDERGKREAKDLAERAAPLNAVGAPEGNRNAVAKDPVEDLPLMKAAQENKGYNVTIESRGNRAEYFAARIARDRPDILEWMKAGEFRSVRQAALEAGIVRPTIAIPLDPAAAARRLAKHFRCEALTALIRGLEVYQSAGIAPGQDISRINDLIVLDRIKAAAERLTEGVQARAHDDVGPSAARRLRSRVRAPDGPHCWFRGSSSDEPALVAMMQEELGLDSMQNKIAEHL